MTLLKPTCRLSTSLFSFDAKTLTFVTEASDLRNPQFDRVWDDSCDVGFTMVSARTLNEVVFALTWVNRDGEGGIVSWQFQAVTPGHSWKALIVND